MFEDEVLTRRFRGNLDPHWQAAKRLIKAIKLSAEDWCRQPEVIYHYFAQEMISPSYAEKILRTLNLWGEFLFFKTGKPYLPVKAAKRSSSEAKTQEEK